MKLEDLATEALKLPIADRARLAETLLDSLDLPTAEENARLWLEESQRRDADLDANVALARPAEAVFRDARARRA